MYRLLNKYMYQTEESFPIFITRKFVYQTERVFLCTHSCTKMGSEKHSVPWCVWYTNVEVYTSVKGSPEQEGKQVTTAHTTPRGEPETLSTQHSALWYHWYSYLSFHAV